MTVIPPVAAVQAGHSVGGGIIDSFKAMLPGADPAAQATAQKPVGDGSVGLFDGVGKKALIGGAAGAVLGFLPFIPGGPILGGIVGALGGVALGVFGNWRKMEALKAENAATLAAMGVQADDPIVQQMLKSGDVSQLQAYAQQQAAQKSAQQGGVAQGAGTTTQTTTQTPVQDIRQVTNPTTGVTQLVDANTGQIVQQGAAAVPVAADPATAGVSQSPMPTQGTVQVGSGAIDPSQGADPGKVPTTGGGSIEETAMVIKKLQQQIDQLKAYLAEQDRMDKEAAAKSRILAAA
jgi:hypothetical protein